MVSSFQFQPERRLFLKALNVRQYYRFGRFEVSVKAVSVACVVISIVGLLMSFIVKDLIASIICFMLSIGIFLYRVKVVPLDDVALVRHPPSK